MFDFEVQNHGTIYLLRPQTDAANEWVESNIPDDAQRLGGIAVEHRLIRGIVTGIIADGLTVE